MTTILLDTHTLYWLDADDDRLSRAANRAIDAADEHAVAAATWYELAWLAERERIQIDEPVGVWLEDLSSRVRTVAHTPAIAVTAAALGATFPKDPADRQIYATAIETGWKLVTKDERMRSYRHRRKITVW